MKKVQRSRKGVITEETQELIQQLQKEKGCKDDEYIFTCTINALTLRVNKFLK